MCGWEEQEFWMEAQRSQTTFSPVKWLWQSSKSYVPGVEEQSLNPSSVTFLVEWPPPPSISTCHVQPPKAHLGNYLNLAVFDTSHALVLWGYILLCYYSCPNISPFPCIHLVPTSLQQFHPPTPSSCLWVVHLSSLASLLPILFLAYPVYFVPTNYVS